jgi:hypothetical protein
MDDRAAEEDGWKHRYREPVTRRMAARRNALARRVEGMVWWL